MDEDIYQQLADQDWSALYPKLVLYAHYRLQVVNYPRRTQTRNEMRAELGLERNEELGLGQTVLDVVQTVIVKTFEGTRHWQPVEGPLLPWLKRQVDSEMDHLYQSKGFRTEIHLETTDDRGQVLVEMEKVHQLEGNAGLAAHARRLEDASVEGDERRAEEQYAREKVDRLLDAIADDPELILIIEAMTDGDDKADAIAAATRFPIEEIYRLKRKLSRRVKFLRP